VAGGKAARGGLLIDGGGTIHTEGKHPIEGRAAALHNAFPDLSLANCRTLAQQLQDSTLVALRDGVQHTDAMTQVVLREFWPDRDLGAEHVRAAMVRSMFGTTPHFEGAAELLEAAKHLGLVTVLVTNTTWHTEADTWARITEMGIAANLDHVISSFELGVRKPDVRMFHAALDRAGVAASDSIMVGDSEATDIAPSAGLGMSTIRVTMQFPLIGDTEADATAATLREVQDLVERWRG
jgi:HAD superfamily hydrolase (TIGR01509 family)